MVNGVTQLKLAYENIAASDQQAAREYNQVKTLKQNSTEQNNMLIFWRKKKVFFLLNTVSLLVNPDHPGILF